MKLLSSLASLSAASAFNPLSGSLTDMLTPAETMLAKTPVGFGVCQGYDAFNFFSLKSFSHLDSINGGPSSIAGFGAEFDYSLCDLPWKLDNGKFKGKAIASNPGQKYEVGTCDITKGNVPTTNTAYWVKSGKCEYNFASATFNGLDYKNGTNHGFQVTWES